MKKKLIAAIGTLLALCITPPVSAITIGFNPSSQLVGIGSTAMVDLVISGLGDGAAPSLGTFDLDVGFDPSILSFSSATYGNQLDLFGLGDIQFLTIGVGTVNLFELSLDFADDLDNLQTNSFFLATLSFNTIASGNSELNITVNALGDSNGNQLQNELLVGNVDVQSVNQVPVPPAFLLLGSGLIGLIGTRRNKKA
jgi:hypothetical protein